MLGSSWGAGQNSYTAGCIPRDQRHTIAPGSNLGSRSPRDGTCHGNFNGPYRAAQSTVTSSLLTCDPPRRKGSEQRQVREDVPSDGPDVNVARRDHVCLYGSPRGQGGGEHPCTAVGPSHSDGQVAGGRDQPDLRHPDLVRDLDGEGQLGVRLIPSRRPHHAIQPWPELEGEHGVVPGGRWEPQEASRRPDEDAHDFSSCCAALRGLDSCDARGSVVEDKSLLRSNKMERMVVKLQGQGLPPMVADMLGWHNPRPRIVSVCCGARETCGRTSIIVGSQQNISSALSASNLCREEENLESSIPPNTKSEPLAMAAAA
eukprot:753370-Hanusia_phi.AAC.8